MDKFVAGKTFEVRRWLDILVYANDGGDLLRHEWITVSKMAFIMVQRPLIQKIADLDDMITNNISIEHEQYAFPLTYPVCIISFQNY